MGNRHGNEIEDRVSPEVIGAINEMSKTSPDKPSDTKEVDGVFSTLWPLHLSNPMVGVDKSVVLISRAGWPNYSRTNGKPPAPRWT